jgi:hypothetical protein
MSISVQLDDLFCEFQKKEIHRQEGAIFIKDGLFDEDRWSQSQRNILFFYKEAYTGPGGYDDLRKLIGDWNGPKYAMWERTAEIAHLLQNITNESYPSWSQAKQCTKDALFSSGAINLKKSGGKSVSSDIDLLDYVKSDYDLLKRQIEIIRPDIVVMGSIKELVDNNIIELGKAIDESGRIFKNGETIFIDYWHPAYRVPAQMYYYTMAALYSKFLKAI